MLVQQVEQLNASARRGHGAGKEADIVLTLTDLKKDFGGSVAVNEISVEVRRGEFLTLLGESGCGKTTTLMMIAGFERPTSGAIILNERDVVNIPAHKRNLGVVFQNYALFPNMSVLENVAYPLKMRRIARKERLVRAKTALDAVRLGGFERRLPSALSGGQQQRVALARALVFDPEVLLMDEPLGALDKKLREMLQSEIRQLHRERGVTVVYVTHDQDEALSLSDRIAVMRNGRIEQIGTPAEIYAQPNSKFVADFVGEATIMLGTVRVGDTSTIELGDGTHVPVLRRQDIEADERIGLMIRPEQVWLTDTEEASGLGADVASISLRVVDRGYYGRDIRYECQSLDESFHSVVRVESDRTSEFHPGDVVQACWNVGSARMFKAETNVGGVL